MSQLSPILRETAGGALTFRCPGCNDIHMIQYGDGDGPRWGWNGDVNKPTFTPSILVYGVKRLTEEQYQAWQLGWGLPEPVKQVCHSFVTDGQIQFLSDSTHELAGQTVPIPEWFV